MDKMFEQTTKMMGQACEQWRTMIGASLFFPKAGESVFRKNMAKWIESVNAAYASNMEAWNKLIQQNEEVFFKMFRRTPMYDETEENRVRDTWSAIVKAQETCQDFVRESLATIENSLRDSQDKEHSSLPLFDPVGLPSDTRLGSTEVSRDSSLVSKLSGWQDAGKI